MITIEVYPQPIMPAYNDITFIVTSDNVAQDNFRFVADIYVNGVFVNRKIVPANPSNDTHAAINVANVLEQYLSMDVDVDLDDTHMLDTPNSYLNYVVKFGEQYGSSGTIYADLLTTTTFYAWNAVYDYPDYVDYSSGDIQLSTSSPASFLTNRPSSGDIYTEDNAWLYFIQLFDATNQRRARVITYDSSGNVIATRILLDSTSGIMHRIMSGPNNLNDYLNGFIISGPGQPIITASVAKYNIQMVDAALAPMSEIYYYTLATNCNEHEKINVVFQNKKGGYDSFAFTLVGKHRAQIERNEFKSYLGGFIGASTVFAYSKSDRAITSYHTKLKDFYTVESDWITEDQSIWLEELISSPDVYVDNGSELIPIVVINSTYERKRAINEKLFNLRLEYKYSYERYRQRR